MQYKEAERVGHTNNRHGRHYFLFHCITLWISNDRQNHDFESSRKI